MFLHTSRLRLLFGVATVFTAATLARAFSVVAPSFDELVSSAQVVVRGTVTDVKCVPIETSQGPAIETLVTLRVERTLKGSPGKDVTLSLLGGKIGRRTMKILGMPAFNVGDRHIVFVADNGRVICPLVSAGHGRFFVHRDAATGREYVARDNQAPLTRVEEVGQPLHDEDMARGTAALESAMSVESFESKILAAVHGAGKAVQP